LKLIEKNNELVDKDIAKDSGEVIDNLEVIDNTNVYFTSYMELQSSDDVELYNIFIINNSIIRLSNGLKTFNKLISKHINEIEEDDQEKYQETIDNIKDFIKYKTN
jgi:hypothetical protein